MISSPFLPPLFADTGLFQSERTLLLMKRIVIGFSLAAICSLAMIGMLYSTDALSWWYALIPCVAFYALPIYSAYKYVKSPPDSEEAQEKALSWIWRQFLVILIFWEVVAALILPELGVDSRLLAICIFLAVVFSHFAPFTIFPYRAIFIAFASLVPLSIQLALLGDPSMVPLGMTGLILPFLEIAVVAWLYRADITNLIEQNREGATREPDMSEVGMHKQRVNFLHAQGAQPIVLQTALAFVLVITLHTDDTALTMWSWYLGYMSIQVLRGSGFISYLSDPKKHRIRGWRLQFGAGVVLNQLAWFAFPFIFQDVLSGFSLGVISGLFIVVLVLSTLGLTVDRPILYLNAILSLGIPIFMAVNSSNFWSLIAFGAVSLIAALLVIETIHRSALQSLKARLLQKLAEYRALQLREVNADLHEARKNLTDTNSSLESQVLERTQELNFQASHDMLTGLGNRYYFSRVVSEALAGHHEAGPSFAIHLLDLNRFKEINDGLGHIAGDQVLCEAARRISDVCGETNYCARWGGDEFVILQKNCTTDTDIYGFAEQIVQALQVPIALESGQVIIGASIGVARCPEHGAAADQLLEHADIAVYRAKCTKENIAIYDAQWGEQAADRHQLAQALRVAIETESLDLAMQPFIGAGDGRIAGFEALARWTKTDGTRVSPELFIPLAEECGLISDLGRWVLRRACETLCEVSDDPNLRVAVNISVVQLLSPDFFSNVMDTLRDTGMSPERLELEMTESVLAGDVERIRETLMKLREQGIRISIDDFGTGYSSISYLRDFPLDTLKIDRSFVVSLDQAGEGIFSSIVTLAQGLDLSIIVEGVETRAQLDSVLRLGGEEIQGYFFSEPVARDEVQDWLAKHVNSPFNMKRRYLSVRSG